MFVKHFKVIFFTRNLDRSLYYDASCMGCQKMSRVLHCVWNAVLLVVKFPTWLFIPDDDDDDDDDDDELKGHQFTMAVYST